MINNNQVRMSNVSIVVIRFTIIIGLLFCAYAAKNYGFLQSAKPLGINPDKYCLLDMSHHLLQNPNRLVNAWKNLAYPMILLSSLMIDFVFVFILAVFIIEAKTTRMLYCVFMFYGIRGLIQVISTQLGPLPIQNSSRLLLADSFRAFANGSLWNNERLLLQWPHRLHGDERPRDIHCTEE